MGKIYTLQDLIMQGSCHSVPRKLRIYLKTMASFLLARNLSKFMQGSCCFHVSSGLFLVSSCKNHAITNINFLPRVLIKAHCIFWQVYWQFTQVMISYTYIQESYRYTTHHHNRQTHNVTKLIEISRGEGGGGG